MDIQRAPAAAHHTIADTPALHTLLNDPNPEHHNVLIRAHHPTDNRPVFIATSIDVTTLVLRIMAHKGLHARPFRIDGNALAEHGTDLMKQMR